MPAPQPVRLLAELLGEDRENAEGRGFWSQGGQPSHLRPRDRRSPHPLLEPEASTPATKVSW